MAMHIHADILSDFLPKMAKKTAGCQDNLRYNFITVKTIIPSSSTP